MRKVLITGGAGFVGLHLSKYLLDRGYEVTIIDNFARPNNDDEFLEVIENENCKPITGDITTTQLFDELPKNYYDDIYHLAAINGTSNFYNHPVDVFKVGIIGTLNVLDWVVKQNKGKVLYTSSCEAYAGTMRMMKDDFPIPTPENIPLSVDDVSNVRWSYGTGKLASEVALNSYKSQYDFDNFSIVRPHNFFGPRMGFEHVIPQFVDRIIKKETPFKIYGGDETRSFCYIDNVIKSLVMIQESDKTNGETYHVGNDKEEITIMDLAKMLFEIAGKEPNFEILPAPEGSVKRRCPNIDKLRGLGYDVIYPTKEGLERTYNWYVDNNNWYYPKES
tara:strand:- start:10470 stop:11471 length:1002 start_codon:yes stop_codon:yes gene_type:complete